MSNQTYLRLVNSNVADLKLADPSLDVGGCKGLHIAEENMGLGDSDCSSKYSTGEQVRETYLSPSLVISASTCGSRATRGRMRQAVFPSSEQRNGVSE